jgi:hypothetical protein
MVTIVVPVPVEPDGKPTKREWAMGLIDAMLGGGRAYCSGAGLEAHDVQITVKQEEPLVQVPGLHIPHGVIR